MPNFPNFGRKGRGRVNGRNDSDEDDSASMLSGNGGDGGFDIKDSEYARKCRELMQLNKMLLDLGAGDMFPLPRVTVIGGQSAGKSSLVEAVSGINVPRDAGTCTRCPMECVMSSSGTSWSCMISIRTLYFSNGDPMEFSGSGKQTFSPLITNPSEVELWIRRAQAAILSPHRSADDFKDKSYDELRNLTKTDKKMLQFSKNMVLVELQDPQLTDLFFYDLPGLVQNAADDAINLVRNLVVEHIGGPHCENNIILITIPMSDDIENQQAVKLARECDPNGARTIGVLTKPDSLTDGAIASRKKWQEILEGKEHPLTHGYYCVKLPDDAERAENLPVAEAQHRALRFFDRAPWNRINVHDRFGIPNLVTYVSKLLVTLIESSLPKLKTEVNRLLVQCQEELHNLPAPPSNDPTAEVSQLVNKFCKVVQEAIVGEGDYKILAQKDRKLYAEFKHRIWNTSLDFQPFVDHKKYRDPDLGNDEPFGSKAIPSPERSNAPSSKKVLDLTEVRQVIVDSIAFELPGHVPFEATKKLVRLSTDEWRTPALACFNSVYENLWSSLEHLISMNFKQYNKLEKSISSIIRRELDSRKDEALQAIEKKIKHETNPLYTQNYHYLSSEKTKWSQRYQNARSHSSDYLKYAVTVSPSHVTSDSTYYSGPQAVSVPSRVVASHSASETYRDEYEDELNLMASVQAYFKVAYKRFIDDIPLLIEHELNQAVANRLPFAIFEDLFSGNTPQKMKELLSEDPVVANHRRDLMEKIAKLTEIRDKLAVF